nr:MAG TPA: hypothetical protein [Caudoviricetes sp.]
MTYCFQKYTCSSNSLSIHELVQIHQDYRNALV